MVSRDRSYLWLCLAATAFTFTGFTVTYFGPIVAGAYPRVSPTVHLHGWSFFAWYLLLPLQAGLIAAKRTRIHRLLGYGSLALALVMFGTGLVVIGTQMRLAQAPDGDGFWRANGPAIGVTLILFVVCYALGLWYRRHREWHKRFLLLASAAGMGAAGFRIVMATAGFVPWASNVGILSTNALIIAAMLLEWRRGTGVHPAYRWGVPALILTEAGTMALTPTPVGAAIARMGASLGTLLAPLY